MSETSPIQLSALQHYAICPRQWGLIHLEQLWQDNEYTIQGDLFHARAHDAEATELRGDTLTVRGMHVVSRSLDLTGICDVVEFHRVENGIALNGYEGTWDVRPVEYKVGTPRHLDADQVQLCAQAMCLEEMLCCAIPEADMYYGRPRRRTRVPLTEELRAQVKRMAEEMKRYTERGVTPRPRKNKVCEGCSMNELCLPRIGEMGSVRAYIARRVGEET